MLDLFLEIVSEVPVPGPCPKSLSREVLEDDIFTSLKLAFDWTFLVNL
jgi:hypothetical protein